ncbi:MAG: hypothetical protein E7334_01900 [Clostridiales bacterium]|nr:hypothetical protein [Clostridiales bacterium]
MQKALRIIYTLLECTWGLPQTVLGFILFIKNRNCAHDVYRGSIRTHWNHKGGISLGLFIFVNKESRDIEEISSHEFGHTVQSLFLGPFYLIAVGLPSFIWCNLSFFKKRRKEKSIPYSALYCEKWADALGGYYRRA